MVTAQAAPDDQVHIDKFAKVQARPGLPGLVAAALAIALTDQREGGRQLILDAAAPGQAVVLFTVVIGMGPTGIQVQAQRLQGLPGQWQVQVRAVEGVPTIQRNVRAGSIVGSGTVSNQGVEVDGRMDWPKGYSCIAEKRAIETILDGKPSTAFMQFGDTIRIEVKGRDGQSVFGAIDQKIAPLNR